MKNQKNKKDTVKINGKDFSKKYVKQNLEEYFSNQERFKDCYPKGRILTELNIFIITVVSVSILCVIAATIF